MMKTVGIYTIQSLNFGNRLQNYATQEILKEIGVIAVSIRNTNTREEIAVIEKKHPWTKRIRKATQCILNVKDFIDNLLLRNANYNFAHFNKLINYCEDYINSNDIKIDVSQYDVILAGSDQIWNMEFPFVSINSFLPFEHPRKIAWAASFGANSIENDENIKKCLCDYHSLSVREESGAKIIKDLTGRTAEVIVDPTMLVDVTQWRAVSKKPKCFREKKYVLTYFLSPKCEKANEILKEMKKRMDVYELMDYTKKNIRTIGPSEFLYLIDHADIILTDSFHASVFSFLFNKPFLVFDRMRNGHDMNSRLETLLKKFNLERKYANSGLDNDIWECDYSEGYKMLHLEKEKAINFLKEAVGVD